jgi:hypothetical protein
VLLVHDANTITHSILYTLHWLYSHLRPSTAANCHLLLAAACACPHTPYTHYYTTLHYHTILHYTTLYYTTLYYTTLHYILLHCNCIDDACFEPLKTQPQGQFRAARPNFINGKVVKIPGALINSTKQLTQAQVSLVQQ